MARALDLAARGLYTTDPNPRVGCVLARAGRILGEGWHERAGEAHAEVRALRCAGGEVRGATAYVTLEPCGERSSGAPSCAERLARAGVIRVVFACDHPHNLSGGRGPQRLRDAGVRVEAGLLCGEAAALYAGA